MQDKNYREYFNYYLELERDFFSTEPYVTVERENFNTFSDMFKDILYTKLGVWDIFMS